jgi:putative NADH-flavin reductase
MARTPIKNVLVIGGGGSVGEPIVQALMNAQHFAVSVLSRATSKTKFPDGVNVIRVEYTHDELVKAFKGQDAVISTITTFSVGEQKPFIDAAVEAGVRRFLPSEYGVDTSDRSIANSVAIGGVKTDTVTYLKSKEESGLSWSALIVGAFFDWSFAQPGVLGWNLPAKSVTIFDGGDIEFEATNLAQIGRAAVAILEHADETANQYVYVNSFTTTQNKMLKAFEELSGEKFQVTHATMEEHNKAAQEKMASDPDHGSVYGQGAFMAICLIMINYLNLCEYSKNKGLWNKRLGLPEEKMEDTVKAVLSGNMSANKVNGEVTR